MAVASPLSYSSVRTYLECPLRWKFLYVDKIPETPRGYFSFGRVVHSVLEELVRPLVVPSARRTASGATQRTLYTFGAAAVPPPGSGRLMPEEEMLATYDREWVSDGYTSPEEEARYRALGKDLLRRYRRSLERERPTPVAVEEHLEARWDGIPIHGYIDRIDRTATGGLEVVDYKTSREITDDEARSSDQLAMYQVLVERNYPDPVEGLTLYHLRSLSPRRSPRRNPGELQSLYERVGAVSDGIRAEAFEPAPGRQCSRCEFKSMCPEFREVPGAEQSRLTQLVDRFAELREQEMRLDRDLRSTAEALHREAERLGVHRVPGSRDIAIRRREEAWRFPPEAVRPLLEAHGYESGGTVLDDETVRKLVRDPSLDAELRRKIAETSGRQVRWYWVLEDANGKA